MIKCLIIVALVSLSGAAAVACDTPGDRHCDETYGDYYRRLQHQVDRDYPDHDQYGRKIETDDDENQ